MSASRSRLLIFASAALVVYFAAFRQTNPVRTPVKPELSSFNVTDQSSLCLNLATALSGRVYSAQDHDFLTFQKSAYAAQAQEDTPACIVRPETTEEVSTAVRVLKKDSNAVFAVRSGGHRPGRGHSSIRGGILVDLGSINDIEVSPDLKAVTLGSGARWGQVYEKLDKIGISVAGGRVSDVGVGGLSLGGGLSYFSPQLGMVCDNILSYEIVLANGTITHASSTVNADLWRSLKGGSSNFGIVTKFVAQAFPAGKVWAGFHYYPFWTVSRLIDAFYKFNVLPLADEEASSPIFSLNYINSPFSLKLACVNIVHTKPEVWPKVWHAFKAIWPRLSLDKVRTITEAALDLNKNSPNGMRQFYGSITIQNDHETLKAIPKLFEQAIPSIKAATGVVWTLVLQPLPAQITHKGSPNLLGLESRDPSNPTPIVVLMCPKWDLEEDDETVSSAARSLLEAVRRLSIDQGSADDYIYLNYAGDHQDPFPGYGEANRQFMVETSLKYDPDRFFQKARMGGYKLE